MSLNSAIRDKIMKEGSFYIVKVELDGKIWIRLTIINPMTTEDDLKSLLSRIIKNCIQHNEIIIVSYPLFNNLQ